jgi:hypothetical protein
MMRGFRYFLFALVLAAAVLTSLLYGKTEAQAKYPEGFLTTRPAQVRGLTNNVHVQPIITTGDTLTNGYTMAAIPDGLGVVDNRNGTFTVLMNHELSKGENLSDARVSRLVIDKKTLRVLDGSYLIDGTEGYHRFCSATMVGPREGFKDYLFMTGEESTDSAYGGIVVAVNPKTGKHTNLPWLGHLSHENAIALPGYHKIVMLTTEDAAPGYLYMYIANNQDDLLAGKGQLYVFVADAGKTPAAISKTKQTSGKFVPISQEENKDAATLKAAATAKGAMAFVRLEDAAYSLWSRGKVYFATTGRSQYLNPDTNKPYDAKGRLHTLQLSPFDPTRVLSLRVTLDGDAGDNILNPDNLGSSFKSVMLQEDINDEFRGVHPGRILRYNLFTHKVTPVAEVVQKDYEGNPIPGDKPGNWESSGIVSMQSILGPGKWLIVTQAHSFEVDQFGGKDEGGQLMLLTVPGS